MRTKQYHHQLRFEAQRTASSEDQPRAVVQCLAQRARWLASLLATACLCAPSLQALAEEEHHGLGGDFDTMTVNLYLGSGTERVLALNPSDPGFITNLVATVTGVYYEILASQPQIRLGGVAKTVAARHPEILAVQEASLLRNQSPGDLILGGDNPATNVVFDYLQMLVDDLAARGLHYAVASSIDEFDVELPSLNLQTGTIDDLRLTDRDAILVRTDLPHGRVSIANPQQGHFTSLLQLPSLGLSVWRGWCSVDVKLRDEEFRYICTHLEEETFPQLQLLQAEELLDGPAAVSLPVVIAGDFNADRLHRNGTVTYDALVASGFTDAWAALHRHDLQGGLTWGHDEFLADPTQPLVWRIDLVLFRGAALLPKDAEVVDMALHRSQPPLWASDHAAVAARFAVHDTDEDDE